jgi:TRAP-type C4-dicarboxylate transport system permease small subunit
MTNAANDHRSEHPRGASPRACRRGGRVLAVVADGAGHLAAALLLLLAVSIVLGIVLRWFSVDNTPAYNMSLFALVWTAFVGAAFTALREHHVTAGIALEKWIGYGTAFRVVRFVIVCGFLVLLAISGFHQAHDSLSSHKTTLDLSQWPVWMGEAAVPVGAVLWMVAVVAIFLRGRASAPEFAADTSAPI